MKVLLYGAIACWLLSLTLIAAIAVNPMPDPATHQVTPVPLIPTPQLIPPTKWPNPGSAKNPGILFFGNSISFMLPGYSYSLCTEIPCTRINEGSGAISGTTMLNTGPNSGSVSCNTRVQPYHPDWLVIQYTENDAHVLNNSTTLSLSDFKTAFDQVWPCVTIPHDHVIIVGCLWLTDENGADPWKASWATDWPNAQGHLNDVLRQEAKDNGARFADTWDMSPTYIDGTGIHPNATGITYLANLVMQSIGIPKGRTT